ncbi:hypothetical protein BJ508DRAFT_418828 [Ascobolus immersus RN42]|uniref:Uncharacterized protein n=1 Tax=Ascobolus immersus RN42 TaxID=1160509 RepID=A0A3N4HJ44_ASCIM|nr:hypothetical protein BJ508DRAFT_418828 [Ascobolus immersus RN42]
MRARTALKIITFLCTILLGIIFNKYASTSPKSQRAEATKGTTKARTKMGGKAKAGGYGGTRGGAKMEKVGTKMGNRMKPNQKRATKTREPKIWEYDWWDRE